MLCDLISSPININVSHENGKRLLLSAAVVFIGSGNSRYQGGDGRDYERFERINDVLPANMTLRRRRFEQRISRELWPPQVVQFFSLEPLVYT
jgi:hypothetical protein